MSDGITDEIVEVAAKAIAAAVGLKPDDCAMGTGASDGDTTCILRMWELYRCHARAALEASLPLIVGGERERAELEQPIRVGARLMAAMAKGTDEFIAESKRIEDEVQERQKRLAAIRGGAE